MGDHTGDVAENRREDRNIRSVPQATHKPTQSSASLSAAPGSSPAGTGSHSEFDFVINLKAVSPLPLNYPELFHHLCLRGILTTPLAPGRLLGTAGRTRNLKLLDQRLDLVLPLAACVTPGESALGVLQERNKQEICT